MLGIIPAAGAGSRIQPLAFSKELLPVGSRREAGVERPRAVSEYLVERMLAAGATRICFVISPGKSDILQYFGGQVAGVPICYTVQERPAGLCDALFRALPFAAADEALVLGLPDTVWFPSDGLRSLPDDVLSFLLFPVDRPEIFDAVVTEPGGRVVGIDVKQRQPRSSWIWGAFKMPAPVALALRRLWDARDRRDEYVGTLVNAFLEDGGRAIGVRTGRSYVDVGTLNGYREALRVLLQEHPESRGEDQP
jgi:glucose-1-phosphate thymidylyltransferase